MVRAEGIDVSAHQTETPNLTGLDFLFARATYGDFPDQHYQRHIDVARHAGLVVGAYHFGRSTPSGAEQARAFLAAAGKVDLYVLDKEADRTRDGVVHPPMTDDQAKEFIATVKAAGHRCGLYHSLSGFPMNLGQDWNWVAAWRLTAPDMAWRFWQYTGGPLDKDRFYGDRSTLRAFAGYPSPAPPPIRPALTYTVRAGDTLSKIAIKFHVPGGWKMIYNLNRRAIGPNPNLIHPGLKLKLPAGSHR